ncbi:SH3 domain-binding glutamic acid-rich-like protein 3 [Lytechinus variegatus]|uniref:SH3 domain-binding glutamic acid-rich-like protein 3 n=1 Tax=Lytechinus variegatus TaxID=7654 RepID=UPI001BB1F201|nr:SH3 domain-binding glutamic acid-rich-like protein 3 [Lytechinus variegatus]
MEIKKNQQYIATILSFKKIDYEVVDISVQEGAREEMGILAGNPDVRPPQLCNGDTYCGDYSAFENAVEAETLEEFLKLK